MASTGIVSGDGGIRTRNTVIGSVPYDNHSFFFVRDRRSIACDRRLPCWESAMSYR